MSQVVAEAMLATTGNVAWLIPEQERCLRGIRVVRTLRGIRAPVGRIRVVDRGRGIDSFARAHVALRVPHAGSIPSAQRSGVQDNHRRPRRSPRRGKLGRSRDRGRIVQPADRHLPLGRQRAEKPEQPQAE